jgi:hypothetical protein
MKKIKIGLFFIILICFGILIYQNNEYFLAKHSFNLDLKITSWQWVLPEVMNIGYFGIFFCLGFLVAAYLGLSSKFRSIKTIKRLKNDMNSSHEQIISLKTELDKFNNDPYINNKLESAGGQPPEQNENT